jgi:hypothetical protein
VLRPFGNGRTRTVRGIGTDTVTVTPRRARCTDCQVTQILLSTALTVRRADSTEAIGTALVAHARGTGYRSIAARFGRPESTVRRWLRGVRDPQWLYRRAVDRAAAIDRELLIRPAPQRTTLGHALNLLAGAALRYRDRFAVTVPVRALIGSFALAGSWRRRTCGAAEIGCPAGPCHARHCADQPRPRTPGDRQFADQAVTWPTTPPISVFIHDEAINGKTNDDQHPARL